jgi:hypothetical protein
MKKLISSLLMVTLFPAAVFVGCTGNNSPLSARNSTAVPTATPVADVTPEPISLYGFEEPITQPAQAMVDLGRGSEYAVYAYDGITNSGSSTICGSIASYPGNNLDEGVVVSCGGVQNLGNTEAANVKTDLCEACNEIMNREGGAYFQAGDDIGGQTIYPGLYSCEGDLSITSNDLTLDAQGDENAVFIIRVNGLLSAGSNRATFNRAASNRSVLLINGAKASNVFWRVSDCSLGSQVSFVGNIMAEESLVLGTGAVLTGRAFSGNVEVALHSNTITLPTP